MRTVTRILSTTVAAAALAGFAGVGTAAAGTLAAPPAAATAAAPAEAPDGEMRVESTRRFTISNLSDRDLRVRSVRTTWDNDPTPAAGTLVRPGDELPVEVTWWFGWDQDVTVTFDILDGQGRYTGGNAEVTMRLGGTAGPSSSGTAGSGLKVNGNGYDVRVVSERQTQHVVPATERAEQSDILNRLVATGKATATFTATGEPDRKAWSAPYISGDEILVNLSNSPATQEIGHGSAQSESTSLEVSASIKLAFGSMVEASLTSTLGHEWSKTETFTSAVTVTAAPREFAWVEARNPVTRVTGDLLVKAGTTTWVLQGVTFDTPDAGRKAFAVARSRAMTADEIAEFGPGLHRATTEQIAL